MIPDDLVLPLLLAGMTAFAMPALWVSVCLPKLRERRAARDQRVYWEGWREGRKIRKAPE